MSWSGFFEGIQDIAEGFLFQPFYALAKLELSDWWSANVINWLFLAICCVAIVYWMRKLNSFNKSGEEERDIVSHKFLGKGSDLESSL